MNDFFAKKILNEMSVKEKDEFLDRCTAIVISQNPPDNEVEKITCEVIDREIEKLCQKDKGFQDMMESREKIRVDMQTHLRTPVSSIPALEEGYGDPSEQLDRLTRRIMAEKGVDYNAGLLEAQRQRKDLAEAILKQLNEYRSR